MRSIFVFAGLLLTAGTLRAQVTPLNTPLVEEKEIAITCELTKTESPSQIPVFATTRQSEKARGIYHYQLWLPPGYLASGERRWPCMFIASPGGNATRGAMAERLRAGGYVVVSLVESRNGPWEPSVGNFLAAHDDVVRRVRVQEGLKFATGMSGAARASSLFVQIRPGFSGVICQGAGFYLVGKDGAYGVGGLRKMPGFAVALTVGADDPNSGEAARLRAALPAGTAFRACGFPGGHVWAPAEIFEKALTWMERQVYVAGPARPELRAAYAHYFAQRFAALESVTSPLARARQIESLLTLAQARSLAAQPSIAASLRTLQTEAARLRADAAVARELAADEAWRRIQAASKSASPIKAAADAAEFARKNPGTEAAQEAAGAAAGNAFR